MFRFFVSFASQPRLAIVVNTLRNTVDDIFHFCIVFVPTVAAFVVSGHILYGRRVPGFSTLFGSMGTCARIMFENEYDWDTISREHYWTTALWIWALVVTVCILMLNMVIAIILDVYNEVRASSSKSEAFWETLGGFARRFLNRRNWVPYDKIVDHLEQLDEDLVNKDMLLKIWPRMPPMQQEQIFLNTNMEMQKMVTESISKVACLGVSGSIQLSVDRVLELVTVMKAEDTSGIPVKPWMIASAQGASTVSAHTTLGLKLQMGRSDLKSFMSTPVRINHGRFPTVAPPQGLAEGSSPSQDGFELMISDMLPPESQPDWLQDFSKHMNNVKQMAGHVQWQIQKMMWQVHNSHLAKIPSLPSRKFPQAANEYDSADDDIEWISQGPSQTIL
jgi:hypothetical protein